MADEKAMTYRTRGEPWFDDGNLIIVTEGNDVAFRVHRGVLARHSEIFSGMLELPQPTSGHTSEMIEGCQTVRMYDPACELSSLVKALYDGANFSNKSVNDFFYLAGILRLSTKYFISHLRTEAIRFLTNTWAITLAGHDAMVYQALNAPLVANTSFPYVHPLHVLNLAHEVNVRIVVPSCIYFLSLYPLEGLLKGDHPKLQVEHLSRPSSVLTTEDMRDYMLMFQRRIDLILEFSRQFCGERNACAGCTNGKTSCRRGFSRLAARLSDSWNMRTGPLHWMTQAVRELETDSMVCNPCRNAFCKDVDALRDNIWEQIPSYIGLPSWTELIATDLPV